MLIAALLTDPEARVRIAAALHGHAELHCCRRVGDLVSILTHRHVDGGVVERQGEMGITTAPTVRRLRRDRPSLPILLYCRLDGTTARSIVALARAGVDDLILPDQGDIGLQLRQRLFVAGMARGAEQVLSELASLLPPTVEPIVAYCLRHAHAPLTVGQIAGALGVHRRTLVNRLATTAMRSPAAIIQPAPAESTRRSSPTSEISSPAVVPYERTSRRQVPGVGSQAMPPWRALVVCLASAIHTRTAMCLERRTRQACFLFSFSLVVLAGCVRSSAEQVWMRTVVQQARRSRPVSDTVAVVVFDPSTCLACDGNLAAWAQARRRVPSAVVLLLSAEPDESVRANFIAQRIPIDGSRIPPQRQQALPTPAEYLVAAGQVIASRHRRGAAQQAGLIDAFRTRIDRP